MITIAGQFLNLKLEYLGFVYKDAEVGQAVSRQKPFLVYAPRCKASQCVEHIVRRLEKTETREGGGFGSMVKRMFG
jgi:flagellar biosynthesis protein FlhG